MVDARDGGEALVPLAGHAVSDLVRHRRVLLDLLVLEEPDGTGIDARGQCAGLTFTLLDVRPSLVLPGYAV